MRRDCKSERPGGETGARSDVGNLHRSSKRPPAPDELIAPFKEAKREAVAEFERTYVSELLACAGGSISRAAALAGIERNSLRALLRRHGLRADA
jgi:DNA-binding NtrC family response regulator